MDIFRKNQCLTTKSGKRVKTPLSATTRAAGSPYRPGMLGNAWQNLKKNTGAARPLLFRMWHFSIWHTKLPSCPKWVKLTLFFSLWTWKFNLLNCQHLLALWFLFLPFSPFVILHDELRTIQVSQSFCCWPSFNDAINQNSVSTGTNWVWKTIASAFYCFQ